MKTIIVTGVECPKCGDQIWSRSVDDYRQCMCGKTYISGGQETMRYGGGGGGMPRLVELEVEAPKLKKPLKIHWKPQHQEDLTKQIKELVNLGNREGLYDAADWLHDVWSKKVTSNG